MKKNKKRNSRRSNTAKALQKRIKKGQQRNISTSSIIKSEGVKLWRPKDGQHIIDIIPYKAGSNDPLTPKGEETYTFEFFVHRNVGPNNSMIICPAATWNKPCPVCEHRQKLRESGVASDEWKKLFPRGRNLYNIICYDPGEEQKGIQIWESPSFYSEKNILAIANKPKRGGGFTTVNFPDPEDGKSIGFTVEPPKSKDDFTSYLGFNFIDRDYSIDEELLESALTLDEIVQILEYKEIEELYYGESRGKKKSKRIHEDEDNEKDIESMMEDLEECEDLEDLEEFIDDNDIDVDIEGNSFKKAKRKIESAILSDNEEEGEDDDEGYTPEDIAGMKKKDLKRIIEEEDLDIDPDDAEDLDELKEMVAEELGLDLDDIPF